MKGGEDRREMVRRRGEVVGQIVIERLHALTSRGYQARLGDEPGVSFIHLDHPKGPPLNIWGDGQVLDAYPTAIDDDAKRTIIDYDDSAGFERFLATVPAPSLITKLKRTSVEEAFYVVLAWVLFSGLVIIGSRIWDEMTR